MKRIFSILYLIFYLVIIVGTTSNNLAQGYPKWFNALDIVFRNGAAICILLYIIRCRPEALRVLWKLFPIALILFDMFSYYDFFVSIEPYETPLRLIQATIIGVIVIAPSWYLCLRFGYLKQIRKNSDNNTIEKTKRSV